MSVSVKIGGKAAPKKTVKKGKAPVFIEKLQNVETTVGKTVIIDCVCEGEPEPDVDWFFDGKLIKDAGRFRYLYEKDDVIGLEIKKVAVEDEGEYECKAFNKSGEVKCKCEILVNAAGRITDGPRGLTKCSDHETATFVCRFEGSPRPEVKWFRGKKQVKSSGRHLITNKHQVSTLQIHDLCPGQDDGTYSVVVSNDGGEDEVSFQLQVDPHKKEEKKEAPAPTKTAAPAAKKPVSALLGTKKKKNKLPIERDGIKNENPEKYYTFGDEIGRGKFSVVKKVTKKADGSAYAAKIIKFDEDSIKFAIREYDIMSSEKMKHPGLVQMHEAYLVRKYLIIIMDLCDGKTLLDFVSHKHALTEDDVANYIRQLCEILKHMHSNNIVHLDLRPTNIRFSSAHELKLLDYNSSRFVANKHAGEVVDVIGDTEFCAPELLNFDPVLPASDMWSVAIIMYILLSGISPFFYEDEQKVVLCVQKVKYEFDEDAFENITSEAKTFIKTILKRAPENRMDAVKALEHKWLSVDYSRNRKKSSLKCMDTMAETDERLYGEEEEDYIEASLVFRTFEEEEYESPESESEEEQY